MSHMQTLITSLVTPNNAQLSGSSVAQYSVTALPAPTTEASSKKAKRKKLTKVEKPVLPERFVPAPVPAPAPTPVPAPRKVVKDVPLTLEEQQELTEAINTMSPENLEGVIEIIRESADLNEEEDEIDLEIDQLKVSTQRKLMNFVLKVSTMFYQLHLFRERSFFSQFIFNFRTSQSQRRQQRKTPRDDLQHQLLHLLPNQKRQHFQRLALMATTRTLTVKQAFPWRRKRVTKLVMAFRSIQIQQWKTTTMMPWMVEA